MKNTREEAYRGSGRSGPVFLAVLAICLALCVSLVMMNYSHGKDERNCRALWVRQNGRMLDFLRDMTTPSTGVFHLCDDPECSVTFRQYIVDVSRKTPRHWTSMPMHVPRKDGKWDPANRSMREIQTLLSDAKRGDLLLVPVSRANVGHIRVPVFSQASRLFPSVVPPALRQRLRCIYSEYEQYAHKSIPPGTKAYLVNSGKRQLLASLRQSGLQFGFGWNIYQVQ